MLRRLISMQKTISAAFTAAHILEIKARAPIILKSCMR